MKIFLDESFSDRDEMLIIGTAINDSLCNKYCEEIHELRLNILHDPVVYQYLNCDSLEKSFHYTQDHRETKNKFIEYLSLAIYECFIYINLIDASHTIEQVKRKTTLSLDRLLKYRYGKSEKLQYYWEIDRKVEWPSYIDVHECHKEQEELLSISDYILGIFRKIYLKEKEIGLIRDYARIQVKIRSIKDYKHKKPYDRKNQFIDDK